MKPSRLNTPAGRSALLAALAVAALPVAAQAAEGASAEADAARAEARRAEVEARRAEAESRIAQDIARREQNQGERDMRERERAQQQALRGQEESIRNLEQARQRLDEASREVAELSSRMGRNYSYSFSSSGEAPRAVLGVSLGGNAERREGAIVLAVSPGGAAAEAGVKAGDVITQLDGLDVSKDSDPSRAVVEKMRQIAPDTKVPVTVLREGKKMNFDIVARAAPGPLVAPLPPMVGGQTSLPRVDILRRSVNGPVGPGPMGPGATGVELRMDRMGGPEMIGFGGASGFGGMEFATLSDRLGSYFGVKSGVLVVRAGADAPYKLQDGDVILAIDGRETTSAQHLGRILRSYQPGETVKLKVQRDRKAITVEGQVPGRRND